MIATSAAPQVAPRPGPRPPALLTGLWGERPASHALMVGPELVGTTPAGRREPLGKYDRRRGAPSDAQLAAHLAGRLTLAAPLIGADGLARALCIDIDAGGLPVLRRALDCAAAAGLRAFAVSSTNEQHNGGHVWALFAAGADPARLRALARQIAEAAGLPAHTELYPTAADIRLPLGVHTWTSRRGELATADGEVIDLDAPGGVDAGLQAITALGRNPLSLLPAPPQVERRSSSGAVALGAGESPIARFNAGATVDQVVRMLEGLAGYAEHRRKGDGSVLMRCGCGQHSKQRGAAPAVLTVQRGRNGKVLVHSYGANCRWNAGPGRFFDPFEVFKETEGLSHKDAVAQLLGEQRQAQPAQATRPPAPPHTAEGCPGPPPAPLTPDELEAHRRDAERKRLARADDAAQTRDTVRRRLAVDLEVTRCERAVLGAMLTIAGSRDWCRPSKARLAEMTGYSLGSVKRALMRLEGYGYFRSEGDGGDSNSTAIRTFLRGSFVLAPDRQMIHEGDSESESNKAWEGGASPGAPVLDLGDGADGELDRDLDRVLAHRAEALARASLHQLVADLAEIAGVALPAELPSAIVELEALAAQLLAAGDAGPVTIAGPVSFLDEGGCSFDPAAAREAQGPYSGQTKDTLSDARHLEALRRRDQELLGQAPVAAPALAELGPQVHQVKGPPRDPATAARYYALLGRAKKSPIFAQRRVLRGLAAALEEWYDLEEPQPARSDVAAISANLADMASAEGVAIGHTPARAQLGSVTHVAGDGGPGSPGAQLALWGGTGAGDAPPSHALADDQAPAGKVVTCAD